MTKIDQPFTGITTNAVASSSVTPEELAAFVVALDAKMQEVCKISSPNCPANWTRVEHRGGMKYAKLQTVRAACGSGASAYCFIDLSNGNILKPAGWKAPAKGARGNIRVGDASNWWNGALGQYGAAYLR